MWCRIYTLSILMENCSIDLEFHYYNLISDETMSSRHVRGMRLEKVYKTKI